MKMKKIHSNEEKVKRLIMINILKQTGITLKTHGKESMFNLS